MDLVSQPKTHFLAFRRDFASRVEKFGKQVIRDYEKQKSEVLMTSNFVVYGVPKEEQLDGLIPKELLLSQKLPLQH